MTRKWIVRSGADIGRAIAELRADAGLRQQDLAEGLGLRRDWLAKIESGRTPLVLEHALRALRRLGAQVTIELDGSTEDGHGPVAH